MHYGLATVAGTDGDHAAIRVEGRFYRLDAAAAAAGQSLPDDLMAVIGDWEANAGAVAAAAAAAAEGRAGAALDGAALRAPLRRPNKLVCIGANYASHVGRVMPKVLAMGIPAPTGHADRPAYFMKPPSTAIVDPGGAVIRPLGCDRYDWEIELGIVVGRRMTNVGPEEALKGVMGYTVSIDMSARDFQMVPQALFKFDLFAGKAIDASCPLGPVIVPADQVGDPMDLRMVLKVNGAVKQDASTAGMINPVGKVLSELSKMVTLEPGDVVLTGTPEGTGVESDEFLSPGDVIEAEIAPIGAISVTVADPA